MEKFDLIGICKGVGFNCPTCNDRYSCEQCKIEYTDVEIRLYDNKTGKALYERLSKHQLEEITKLVNPRGWL